MPILVLLFVLFAADAHAQSVPCAAKDGDGLAACVNAAYPEKRVPTKTLAERKANAEFLRDRLIETARCAALDVGRNCKRGNCADISVDFVAWKTQGRTQGVDVIGSWDDLSRTISVGWYDGYGPPTYGSPTYQAYGPVSCVGQPDPTPNPTPSPTPNPNPGTPDLGPILSRLDALEANLSDIRNHISDIRGMVAREEAARMNGDVALREDIEKIPTVPTRCVVKLLGLPVSCRVE